MGQVRRRWGRSDGGGAGQTAVGQVRRRWCRSDGGGADQTAVGLVVKNKQVLPGFDCDVNNVSWDIIWDEASCDKHVFV